MKFREMNEDSKDNDIRRIMDYLDMADFEKKNAPITLKTWKPQTVRQLKYLLSNLSTQEEDI